MENHSSIKFNPWLLLPLPDMDITAKPRFIITPGVPDDGLPAITDELRWVSRNNKRNPVQVIKNGVSEWCPDTRIERKESGELSIQLVVKGKGKLNVNGKEFDLEVNDVFILHEGEKHVYNALPPERFRREVIFLHPQISSKIIKQTGLDKVSRVRLSPSKAEYFHKKLEHIDLVNRSKQEDFIHTISSSVYELLLMLSEEAYGQIDTPDLPDSLIKAMAFILDNLDLELHCETIAEKSHCSAGHITKLFKRYLNTSPHHWMERQKMTRATVLLQISRKKVFEIAEGLGYCDQFHFAKAFKRVIGMSPTIYRQRWRNKTAKR